MQSRAKKLSELSKIGSKTKVSSNEKKKLLIESQRAISKVVISDADHIIISILIEKQKPDPDVRGTSWTFVIITRHCFESNWERGETWESKRGSFETFGGVEALERAVTFFYAEHGLKWCATVEK